MTERVKKPTSERTKMEEAIAKERVKAMAKGFKPEASDEWRDTKAWWAKASDDERQDMLYGIAFYTAAKPKMIAKYFSVKETDLKPFQEQLQMGEAARVMKINAHQMRWAITTNIPNAKFFLGLQFAGQVQNPVHEDAASLDEKKDSNIQITVIGGEKAASNTDDQYDDGLARHDQPLQ